MSECQAKSNAKGWDDAINFGEGKIKELRDAVKHFRKMKADGKPWPGVYPEAEEIASQAPSQSNFEATA